VTLFAPLVRRVGAFLFSVMNATLARWAALCPIIFNAFESYKHRTGYHPRPS
jgi:hypothetical protein